MMRSRLAMVLILVLTSAQIAFLPVAEAAAPGDRPSAARSKRDREARIAKSDRAKGVKKREQSRLRRDRAEPGRERTAKQARVERRARNTASGGGRLGPAIELSSGVIPGAEERARRLLGSAKRYIVVLKGEGQASRSAVTELSDEPGVVPTHLYRYVFSGFAAYLTPEAKRELAQDPRVASITEDQPIFFAAQTLPAGIDRVDADLNPLAEIDGVDQGVDVDIAIVDSGVDLNHPDLNVFTYMNCSASPTDEDRFDPVGHGTHVAGIAAARDNNLGVVGVAPGARIWAMRVANDNGSILESYLIDCLDRVKLHTREAVNGETIDTVNISLGRTGSDGACTSEALHRAICEAVEAGATIAVAAGNDARDAARDVPAAYDQVITVSALADMDGKPGGLAGRFPATCQVSQLDDGLATFSNFGPDVDLAAPGVDILSTFPTYLEAECLTGGEAGYEMYPGTSMASPHVAGAAALIKVANPSFAPAQVKAELLATREDVHLLGDPDGIDEGILNLGDLPGTTQPDVTIAAPNSAKSKAKITLRVNATDPDGIDRVILHRCTPVCQEVATDSSAPYSFVRRHTKPGKAKYLVRAVDATDTIADEYKTITIKKEKKDKKEKKGNKGKKDNKGEKKGKGKKGGKRR